MKRKTIAALALGGALVLGGAGYVAAQQAQQGPRGPGGPGAMMERMCQMGPARLAAGLAFAEVRLGITDAQRPAWTTFAQEARASWAPIGRACGETRAPADPTDFAARLAVHERMAAAFAEALRTLRPAVERMQAQLTPEQRRMVAEVMERGPGRMGRGMRGHGMGPGGPGGPPRQ